MHICGGEGLLTGTDPEGHQRQLKKKQKNRASAQRSRRKHTDKADALHQQHEALEKHNHALRKEIQGLRAELAWWGRTLHMHERLCLMGCASCWAPLPRLGEDIENKEVIVQELEHHFPDKSKWERVSHLKFKHGEIVLIPYPFVLTLYVELKWFNENLSTGKPIDDSPLGLVPAERKAARAMKKKRKRMELSVSPSRPGLDRAKMRTSSQGPSKKKFLMETSRNMERNTQQKCQETPAFDGTDVQEQGSRWEDNLAGEITPPVQQSNPPPPAGPTDLGTSGFFGFLSSLFPFRYFFRKSSQ
ncbi:Hypothetical protein D623_10030692 [Myotis brandtii]|uniref:Basic leucine zipper transcriptional factor ATF-like 2 n=1 Tax=Myotis brandtii TaxID=109478 RepID=S7MT48_MYOBR|nr:Hypothetical protein D623_10030692 [Myotis brandtii]